MKDIYGREIVEGCRVAYAAVVYSTVAIAKIGTIVSLTEHTAKVLEQGNSRPCRVKLAKMVVI